MKIDTNDMISVADATRHGISKLVDEASQGRQLVVLRDNRPAAAIVDIKAMERLHRLDELEENLRIHAVALVRTLTDSGERYELGDVAAAFGIDLDQV